MKCKIPEISWHNRDPVLSVDIQPKTTANNCYRLASGGTDAHVLIWYMKLTSKGEYGDIELDLAADLTRHQRAVNAVKWSPNGELLASGDDESVVFIWKLKSDSEPVNILDSTNEQDKEVWITLKVLRGHMEDIYDLSWAPNSLYLVSGSVDNSAMVWDVQKGKSISILRDHKGFVQGVAWDPKNQYIATLSTDRYLRIFDIQSKKVLYRISKGTLPLTEDNPLHGKRMRLFHDDTLQTFFRRLSFTPDGKLLLTPAGVTDYDGCTSPINTTYAFSRYGFRQPAIVLPCPDQYTVAVRCCPILYKLRPFNAEKNPPVVPLPYRMIFAVATKSSVYFYDTQQKQPFALISNIHYTRLTDITWSNDGRIVVVSSTDGFCSLITFEQGELGEEYEYTEAVLEAALAQVTKKTKKQKDADAIHKSRKPSTDDSVLTKQNDNKQKEVQLEKKAEQESLKKEDEIKSTTIAIKHKPDNEEKSQEDKLKDNDEKQSATPIAIKRKPGPTENQEKDNNKANPIAIKRKPGPVEDTKTNDNKTEQKPTPIAIKRKPGPVESIETKKEITEDKESIKPAVKTTSPKADAKIKLGSVEETKTKENKYEQKPTPIAIKRKGATVESADPKKEMTENKDSLKPSEETTPPKADAKIKLGSVEDTKTKKNKDEQKSTPIAIKRKGTPVESADSKKEITEDKDCLKPSEETTPTKADAIIHLGLVEETKTKENKYEQKQTPIAIKRKAKPVESADPKKEITVDKESLRPSEETTPPKADEIIQKGSVEDTKTKENKDEQKSTPIAIKRNPTPVESADPKKELTEDKDSLRPSEETTPPKAEAIIQTGSVEDTKTKKNKDEQESTSIAIKRKTTPVETADPKKELPEDKDSLKPSEETTPPKIAAIIPTKVLAAEIIIDKEILSSEEKFESPEKKSRPATPILVRRHPRTPSSAAQTPTASACQTPTSMSSALKTQLDLQNQSPLSSITKEVKTPRQDKKATPIAVRRAPRAIITTPSVVNPPSMVEEAMDAWPSSKDSNIKETSTDAASKNNVKESGIAPLPISDATCERTEDIRLVYEETNEEAPVKESLPMPTEIEETVAISTKEKAELLIKQTNETNEVTAVKESLPKPIEVEDKEDTIVEEKSVDTLKQHQTPSGPKTPRRVALKTISTPKSKKKLLD